MVSANGEKWEICDDDGFLIYKLKRCRLDLTVSIDGLPLAVEVSDSEEKFWRDRNSEMLLKSKARYQELLEQREILSSMMGRTRDFQERKQEWERDQAMKYFNEEVAFGSLMKEEIHYQIEAKEMVICSISNLCNNGEELCETEEGLLKQHLINLPIWGSPRELMASLFFGIETSGGAENQPSNGSIDFVLPVTRDAVRIERETADRVDVQFLITSDGHYSSKKTDVLREEVSRQALQVEKSPR